MVPLSGFRRLRHHHRAVEEEKEVDSSREESDEIQSEGQRHVVDQRRGKSRKQKGDSHGSRRKMQAKAKQLVHPPLRRFENKTTGINMRRSASPFPYDGEDFGGTPSRYICFLNPSVPLPSASQTQVGTGATAQASGEAKTIKSKSSSYYDFVKTLIENNDFYSPECNVHRDVPRSQDK